jgi:hypothetical protein
MRDGSIRPASSDDSVKEKAMTPGDSKLLQSELDRFGIERVRAEVFLWGGYRYSNPRDAIAAARRAGR